MVNNTLPYYLNPDMSVGHVPPTYNPLDLITSSFPPCFVLVATKDSLIPPKQSYDFIAKLREHQVDHEFTEADMEHGQSEVALKEQVPCEYEAWFTNHIRFGLDWTIGRLDHCASQNGP
jgi:acetyl esterase/lipase